MEEIRGGRPNFTFFNSEKIDEEEEARSNFFSELKTYSLDLLDLLQNPKKKTSSLSLSQLHDFLCRCPPDALQPFFDYTLVPLLLLLDAAVECRSSQKVNAKPDSLMSNVLKTPPDVSDVVAEGVLKCLEELLKRCHLDSVDQMVVLLKKLTYGALLSPSEAAEEFREGIIKCFRALLLNLCLCSDESCACKQVNGIAALSEDREWRSPLTRLSKNNSEPAGCLLAFLQSQSASTAVGHWLSLLLKASDVEAARGHRGSAKLRIESFLTLRILVAKVGTADALAFFLPGVVSQFAKVLHVSKTMISGASGRVEAIDQAIRGLAEFLMIVLQNDANLSAVGLSLDAFSGFQSNKDKSPQSFLEELRQLPVKSQSQNEVLMEDSSNGAVTAASAVSFKEKEGGFESGSLIGSFHVNRTKDWIVKTAAHVDKLLSATFPNFCVHPAKKVRRGLLAAIRGLFSKCSYTLKESRMMLLECLCILVCDDSEEVSKDAQVFLGYLLSADGNHLVKNDLSEIFSRLVEKLPNIVLGSEESLAVSHAKKLLVVIYFSGPRLVVDHLFQSPVTTARFLDVFALCLSQNSVFAGSLDKLILTRPSSMGYLPSISEIKAGTIMETVTSGDSNISSNQSKKILHPSGNVPKEYELPRMPPWFAYVGSQKLYEALAWILRLVGLALMTDLGNGGSLSVITDIPLGYFRNLVSEVRIREYGMESWQSWYNRTGSGQLVRKASTAACILNEIMYGISDQAADDLEMMFQNSSITWEKIEGHGKGYDILQTCQLEHSVPNKSIWKVCQESGARRQFIDCVGSVLHEYQSPEVWDIPIEHKSYLHLPHSEVKDVSLHLFRDNIMLREVIIHGIGIFNMCLGKEFSSCGFLHSSLYVLLENLSCSNFHIRSACDAVLHIISSTSGYPTVGHLVLANSDYVIDSICRQLRHLDLNPHAPNVLASMLSYIGVAHKILPLLEEPMRAVSVELEILGRHQHPDLTIPFLKAVAEIAKASKCEACSLPTQAVSYSQDVKYKVSALEKKAGKDSRCSTLHEDSDSNMSPLESEVSTYSNDDEMAMEQWEEILFKLNDSKRYRQTVGSIVNSCLTAATPLLASEQLGACLVALDIVEDGILALAKVEEAYKHEKETKEAMERVFELCSYHNFKDTLDSTEDGTNENRLLPAVNKIWPFLVSCVRNKNPVAVRRCSGVVSNVVHICGGDFFSRRFHVDGPHFWKLLSTSPFQKKPISKEERTPLQLPYRISTTTSENSIAEVSSLKIQVAVLNMIAELSRNKRSASALEAVLKKVSGLVVGVACSSVIGLRDASVEALKGLASIDPDLIWLLLADVYYSLKKREMPLPPTSEFPEISDILPPPLVPKGYLYVQYGGQSYGFDIDFSSVETVFKRLHSEGFGSQMYS